MKKMENFSDYSVWGTYLIIGTLLTSLLVANIIKNKTPFLKDSLIPTSVLGGLILLLIAGIYRAITGEVFFELAIFGKSGFATLETLTYHALALGFIASTLKNTGTKLTKERSVEIFNTGVTTVSTYLIQGALGIAVTFIGAFVVTDLLSGSGILLAFGFGQGTGQAMNYGGIFEDPNTYNFVGGKSFGLTIAAAGFLFASLGGVLHLNILKHRGKLKKSEHTAEIIDPEQIQGRDEIPMQESIDKITVQIALIAFSYMLAYVLMYVLGNLLPGMASVIYGFNFLLGVLTATLVKLVINFLRKKKIMKKEHINNFLLTRISNFFFDLMVVAGIAAIRLDMLEKYIGIILILSTVGFVVTYAYNRLVAKVLFKKYPEEQFLMMYGMLTGTACTGTILLREIDGDFKTPASDNLVYQNFPAIVFGFPLMFLATMAPSKPILTMIILFLFFGVMNVILFRSLIFKKKKKEEEKEEITK